MDSDPYSEFLDDDTPEPADLTLIALDEPEAFSPSKPAAAELRLLNFDNEFAVLRPDPRGNPLIATNALLKAVYTAWFDDLNRRLVRRQIGGKVADLAHISAAIAVMDVACMLKVHANYRYSAQCNADTHLCLEPMILRLVTQVPSLTAHHVERCVQGLTALIAPASGAVRSEYLWQELVSGQGRNFDLSAYLYYAQPIVETLKQSLPAPTPG